jgi:hypothetical protein
VPKDEGVSIAATSPAGEVVDGPPVEVAEIGQDVRVAEATESERRAIQRAVDAGDMDRARAPVAKREATHGRRREEEQEEALPTTWSS